MKRTAHLHLIRLPLRHPFRIATGIDTHQDALLVELREERDGVVLRGFGESSAVSSYGMPAEKIAAALEPHLEQIAQVDWDEPGELHAAMHPWLGDKPFAMCAVDLAAHDLWGQRHGKPLHQLWGLEFSGDEPASNYTIGIDTIPRMGMKLQEFPGWPIYKVKLGTPEDVAIMKSLRGYAPDATFRVDANTAWSAQTTLKNADQMVRLGVEFLEQPLQVDDVKGMRHVKAHCRLPVIADESCQIEGDVARCAEFFDGVNIKLTKCGGLTPARRMIAKARELGLKVMVGCMTETTVGCSAIAQLLPLLDYVDMDGVVLVAEDVAAGLTLDKGRAVLSGGPGLGLTWLGQESTQ